jgi:hypothetical protein
VTVRVEALAAPRVREAGLAAPHLVWGARATSPDDTTAGRPCPALRVRTHISSTTSRVSLRAASRARAVRLAARRRSRSWAICGTHAAFRSGRDLQRSSRGHHRGRESDGCLCPVGVAMAEVGNDETVTLLFARETIVARGPSVGRLCLRAAPRITTMLLVAGSAASLPCCSNPLRASATRRRLTRLCLVSLSRVRLVVRRRR